jgi:hypothetical protein
MRPTFEDVEADDEPERPGRYGYERPVPRGILRRKNTVTI